MSADLKLFLQRLLLFLPIAIFVSLPVFVLWRAGEFLSLEQIISRQQQNHSLIGLAYSEPNPQYKFMDTIMKSPEVLALGSSRVMQFQDYYFTKSFYNAGGGVAKPSDFEAFLRAIPEASQPKVIIIGLDQFSFNQNWSKLQPSSAQFLSRKNLLTPYYFSESYPSYDQNMVYESFADILSGKIGISKVLSYRGNNMGLQAMMNQDGYRPDGSYLYTKAIKLDDPSRFENVFERINAGTAKFEYGSEPDSQAILYIKNFLAYAKSRQIHVVGFFPPYADVTLAKMAANGNYTYIDKLPGQLGPLFKQYQYPLFNFTDISSVGSSDAEAIDGFHGGDVTYLRLLIKMIQGDKTLQRYADVRMLDGLLKNKVNNFIVKP